MRWSRTPRRKSRRRRPRASRSLAAGRSGFRGEPAPAKRIRDDLASGLADAPKTALTSHLFGRVYEREMRVFDEIVKNHTRFTPEELDRALKDMLGYEIEDGPKSVKYMMGQ